MIRQRQDDSDGPNGSLLYARVLRAQRANIRFVVAGAFRFQSGGRAGQSRPAGLLLVHEAHLIFILGEVAGLLLYLALIIRSFTKMTPLVAATREEWRSDRNSPLR